MKDYKNYFKNKKITVMGLGLLGRGVGDVKFLAECGADLIITDLKTEKELKPSLDQLKTYDISYVLGGHRKEDFKDRDLIIKAAGVPLDSSFIEEARKNNIPVKMSTSLFAEFFPGEIIGVTGTRGKSTVAAMIYEILQKAGKKVFLGGNTRGISTLAHLPESTTDEFAVLELDSWQLQGFGEEQISPHVAIFTTFFPDHLNYYRNDLDAYMIDKANIFKFQGVEDFFILGDQASATILSKYENEINSKILISKIENWNLKIPGEHNKYNASCAAKACEVLGVEEEIIKESLENFEAVEGRLQFVREINGIKIYNDTTSTTPNATVSALKALGDENQKNIVLILGGSDKNLDTGELLEILPKFCKAIVTLPGTGTDKLNMKSLKLEVFESNNLKEAVGQSINLSSSGDTVLFSPAFASFGPSPSGFKNEFDRGDQFLSLVKNLTKQG